MLPYTAIDLIIAMNAQEAAHRDRRAAWLSEPEADRRSKLATAASRLRGTLSGATARRRPAHPRPAGRGA
jgi:hypothetical protein